jgi:23S rRNA (uracil1939-C5)-methyltransferase
VGFFGRRTNEIVAVDDCVVAAPIIRCALRAHTLAPPIQSDRFTVYGKEDLLLSEGGTRRGAISLCGKHIELDAGVFFQSNSACQEKLVSAVAAQARVARDQGATHAFDLYAGVGAFSAFFAEYFECVSLVEENQAALALARKNVHHAHAQWYAQRMERFIEKKGRALAASLARENVFVVADPPRAGLSREALSFLIKIHPRVLVYVSCDAASLARDARLLCASGFHVQSLCLYDFYPQTPHIETLAVLS